jgi:hypothetical protein
MLDRRKLKSKTVLIITLAPVVVIVMMMIGISKLDPMYKTSYIKEATITKRVALVGKSGANLEIYVEAVDGDTYRFVRSSFYKGRVGYKVNLRLYQRKLTGLQTYRLEKFTEKRDSVSNFENKDKRILNDDDFDFSIDRFRLQ